MLVCALDAFERLKSKAKGPLGSETYYDITNGYMELYTLAVGDGANVFDCEDHVTAALRYGQRGAAAGPEALT